MAEIKVFQEEETQSKTPLELVSVPSPATWRGNAQMPTDVAEDPVYIYSQQVQYLVENKQTNILFKYKYFG